jgi:hypothetical protein
MPAHIGALDTFGLTAPVGGYVHETSREGSVEIDTVKDATGVTVVADPKPLVTKKISMKGQGDPVLASVSAGAFAVDVVKIISMKRTESNDKRPEFEISAVAYSNLAA